MFKTVWVVVNFRIAEAIFRFLSVCASLPQLTYNVPLSLWKNQPSDVA